MKYRWLAGLAIFALGFGCAHLVKTTTADAAEEGALDEGLQVVEHDEELELIDHGIHRYLLVVKRKDGTTITEPAIGSARGSAVVSKKDLESLTIIRLMALAELTPVHQRECRPDFEDCVEPDPLLPPRPPKPLTFLGPL